MASLPDLDSPADAGNMAGAVSGHLYDAGGADRFDLAMIGDEDLLTAGGASADLNAAHGCTILVSGPTAWKCQPPRS